MSFEGDTIRIKLLFENENFRESYLYERAIFCPDNTNATPSSANLQDVQSLEESVSSVYPNPVRHILHIEVDKASDFQVQLFNHLGQIVRTQQNSAQMNVEDLPNGQYFLK